MMAGHEGLALHGIRGGVERESHKEAWVRVLGEAPSTEPVHLTVRCR